MYYIIKVRKKFGEYRRVSMNACEYIKSHHEKESQFMFYNFSFHLIFMLCLLKKLLVLLLSDFTYNFVSCFSNLPLQCFPLFRALKDHL